MVGLLLCCVYGTCVLVACSAAWLIGWRWPSSKISQGKKNRVQVLLVFVVFLFCMLWCASKIYSIGRGRAAGADGNTEGSVRLHL